MGGSSAAARSESVFVPAAAGAMIGPDPARRERRHDGVPDPLRPPARRPVRAAAGIVHLERIPGLPCAREGPQAARLHRRGPGLSAPIAGDPDLERLRTLIESAHRAVVFTGAGISTESGIPDFRSPGGIWSRRRPVDFRDFAASESARREAWSQRVEGHRTMAHAEPNHGHRAIASLVRRGIVTSVITQNIDGLHQRSGVPCTQVIELHGNSTRAKCIECEAPYPLPPILDAFERDGTLPVCERCGGHVKTATISFGQAMPEAEMRRAEAATAGCDLFLAIGSSLVVYPAAGFPIQARRRGATLVILNRDPTKLDGLADLVLNREIGVTLGAVTGVN